MACGGVVAKMTGVEVITEQLHGSGPFPIYCHLTIGKGDGSKRGQITLYVTDSGENGAMGSFVYALPSPRSATGVFLTKLFQNEGSIDVAERLAQLMARKFSRPILVSCSLSTDSGSTGLYSIIAFVQTNLERVDGESLNVN